jgi:hypothetical protein
MKASLDNKRSADLLPGRTQLYWFLVNNRIFFITAIIVISFCLINGISRRFLATLLLFTAGGLITLAYRSQLPDYLLLSTIYFDLLLCVLVTLQQSQHYLRENRMAYAFVALLLCWGIVRMKKTGDRNKVLSEQFVAYHHFIRQHPDRLFVVVGDAFPLVYAPLFADPRTYALPNYLDSDHFLQNIYTPVFSRFGLRSFRDIPNSPKVYFLGTCFPELPAYFRMVNGRVPALHALPQDQGAPPLFQLSSQQP